MKTSALGARVPELCYSERGGGIVWPAVGHELVVGVMLVSRVSVGCCLQGWVGLSVGCLRLGVGCSGRCPYETRAELGVGSWVLGKRREQNLGLGVGCSGRRPYVARAELNG